MNQSNPWTTLVGKLIYENPWIRVREDSVTRPDGTAGIYGVVEFRKVATGVVALTPNQEIYLVGQYRYPTKHYSWEIVEGGAEDSESPLVAAQRELAEEAGLEAKCWQPLGGDLHLSNCVSDEIGVLFLAQDLTCVPRAPDPTEVLSVRKVPFLEALAMVDSGEIKDALSVIGILRAARFLEIR